MNLTYACPKCEAANRCEVDPSTTELVCARCAGRLQIEPPPSPEGPVERCVVCPCRELYLRKDFSQRLGLAIIVLGFLASSVAWYYYMPYLTFGILGATALVDFLIYLWVGDVLQCYRCHAEYRGVAGLDSHERFSLETHERHRQELARLQQQ